MSFRPATHPRFSRGLCQALAALGVAISSTVAATAAAPLNQTLAEAEVSCNEIQLEKMLQRMSGGYNPFEAEQIARTTFITYSNSVGFYEGLVVNNQYWHFGSFLPQAPPETYLAFHINPSIRRLLLNPLRPLLGQVALVREESGSNLIEPDPFLTITLNLNPTLGTGTGSLMINNLRAPGSETNPGISSGVKPGRGLSADDLLDSCHNKFSDFDRHVFAILPRIMRPLIENEGNNVDIEVGVFRGHEANSYRLNVYGVEDASAAPVARVALELTVQWNDSGELRTGTLRILPPCAPGETLGCTAAGTTQGGALVIPPTFGTFWSSGDPRVRQVSYFHDQVGAPAQIDFQALLAASTWNHFPE